MSLMKELTFTSIGEMFTPFAYRDCVYKIENEKCSISSKEFKNLSKIKGIQDYHINILKLFAEYKYLTKHMVEQCFGNEYISIAGETVSIKSAISYLVDQGVLLRFYLEQTEPLQLQNDDIGELGDSVEGAYPNKKRSVNIYTPSKGGYNFLIKEDKSVIVDKGFTINEKTLILDTPEIILKKLALNQFLVRVSKTSSKGYLTLKYANKRVVYTKDEMSTAVIENARNDHIDTYYILSVRYNEGWQDEALSYIKNLVSSLVNEKKKLENNNIVFICETRWQTYELFKYLLDNKAPGIHCFFTCDGYVNNYEEYYFSEFYLKDNSIYQGEIAEPF